MYLPVWLITLSAARRHITLISQGQLTIGAALLGGAEII